MSQPSEQYADTNSSSGYRSRVWLTPAQLDYSENFIGSQRHKNLADAIRGQELIGSDGIVRAKPGINIPYDKALGMLGMGDDSWTDSQSVGTFGDSGS